MTTLHEAFEHIDQFIEQKRAAANIPGVALAVTDRARTLHVTTYGWADMGTQTPIAPGTLFEIGSIGKSFTSIALLQLHEVGRIDLHAPVTRYLPWFAVQSQFEPITLHHLMSHTAGLIQGADITSDSRFEVVALRDTHTGSPPGTHYHYSNVGYRVLGAMLEDVCDQPYGDIIRERILDPLDMLDTDPIITHDTRKRMAIGYQSFYDDRPAHPEQPVVPATWFETNTADGCIASTVEDMAAYLRMLLNRGRGPQGRLLSEESYGRLTQRVIETEEGWFYGYGLDSFEQDGHHFIGHGGGMDGYSTGMRGDLDGGFGLVVLVNNTEAYDTLPHAFDVLCAAFAGKTLPPLPDASESTRVENASDYAGTYRAGNRTLALEADGDRLMVRHGDERIALERRSDNTFYTPHPAFDRHVLRFGRDGDRVVEAFFGADWYVGENYTGSTTFDYPDAWHAFTGHYRSYNPWLSNFRVVLRKGRLTLILPHGEEQPLVPLGDDVFRVGEAEWLPERLRFDTLVEGHALRANLSGCDYYRTFTP